MELFLFKLQNDSNYLENDHVLLSEVAEHLWYKFVLIAWKKECWMLVRWILLLDTVVGY